jgi:putative membrane protein
LVERKAFKLMDDRFGYHEGMHQGFPWCLAAMVVGIALLVAGVILLVRYVDRHRSLAQYSGASRSSEELLRNRLASGEIGVDEFRERMAALRDQD